MDLETGDLHGTGGSNPSASAQSDQAKRQLDHDVRSDCRLPGVSFRSSQQHYRQMESAVASDRLSPAVDAHLSLAVGIVRDRLRTSDGFRMLSEVPGLAAWLAADRGDNAMARRRYVEAIGYTKRAHHPLLAAYMRPALVTSLWRPATAISGCRCSCVLHSSSMSAHPTPLAHG